MFKKKDIMFGIAIMAIIVVMILFSLERGGKSILESSFDGDNGDNENEPEPEPVLEDMPGLMTLQYNLSTKGKKSVFPMILEKITPGPIELPNRRSLLNKDAKYKFKDIMPGESIKAVSLQNLSYTVDHMVFNDDFLVTDNDLVIAVTQAKEQFKRVE